MKDEAIVTVIATGFDAKKPEQGHDLADKLIFNTPEFNNSSSDDSDDDNIFNKYKKQETPKEEEPAPKPTKAADEYPRFIKRLLEKAGK